MLEKLFNKQIEASLNEKIRISDIKSQFAKDAQKLRNKLYEQRGIDGYVVRKGKKYEFEKLYQAYLVHLRKEYVDREKIDGRLLVYGEDAEPVSFFKTLCAFIFKR